MDVSNASIAQLKKWLSVLQLPTTGTKRELILRLSKMSTESRNYLESVSNQDEDGNGSNGGDEYEENLDLEDNGDENDNGNEEGVKNNDEAGGEGNDKQGGETKGKVGGKNGSKVGGDQSGKGGDKKSNKDGDESSSKDGGENNNDDGGEGEDKVENCARNDKNKAGSSSAKAGTKEAVEKGNAEKSKFLEFYNPSIDVSLSMATQVLSEFSGETCARKWITQMNNIATIYGISGQYIKMLMISKIKGKANVWLHANPERIMLPLEELTAELISMFSDKVSKLEARRQFENRKWSSGESFGSYVDDKVMLGQRINIDAEEMISRIIEGIPNQGLRNQAHIQCFENVALVKRAFAEVELPKAYGDKKDAAVNKDEKDSKDSKDTRCYNCNAKGHWAQECRKPRREKGSCYACGEMGHFVAKCQKNKIKNEGKNNYNAS
ncbi:uncharacterized protein LOC116656512 [Drosophila ananassae]|uniref:uncharacterized protein LOC116656512 n=1 Tax=Drosophila ananassae TaxID=7217 RepID=UPI0013A5EED3|nr:uncharacterized protein LOC116656512 [Drosophila ananassae]